MSYHDEKSFRSLTNYKGQERHRKAAQNRGNLKAFESCTTLTQARKLAFGEKDKCYSGWKGHPELVAGFRGNAPGGRNK